MSTPTPREVACEYVRGLALGTKCSATKGAQHGRTCDTLTAVIAARDTTRDAAWRDAATKALEDIVHATTFTVAIGIARRALAALTDTEARRG